MSPDKCRRPKLHRLPVLRKINDDGNFDFTGGNHVAVQVGTIVHLFCLVSGKIVE